MKMKVETGEREREREREKLLGKSWATGGTAVSVGKENTM